MRTQIWQDNAVTRGESLRRRNPEFMICGEGVKQDDGWSIAQNRICDLGISATNAIHAQILNARSVNRVRPWSAGRRPLNNTHLGYERNGSGIGEADRGFGRQALRPETLLLTFMGSLPAEPGALADTPALPA